MNNFNSQHKVDVTSFPPSAAKKAQVYTNPGSRMDPPGAVAQKWAKGKFNSLSPKKSNTNKPNKLYGKGRKTYTQSKGTTIGLKIKRVLSLSQILGRIRQQRQKKLEQQKRQTPIKPIIPPKSLILILKDKPEKAIYNRRIIDYKHCGLLQRYIGLGGKILPRRQTRLTAKQQRYIAKTIKSARIMGLLPFVSKERGFFR